MHSEPWSLIVFEDPLICKVKYLQFSGHLVQRILRLTNDFFDCFLIKRIDARLIVSYASTRVT